MAKYVADAPYRGAYCDPAAPALSVTTLAGVQTYGLPKNAVQAIVYPAAAVTMGFSPRLRGAYFYDASNAAGSQFLNMLGADGLNLLDRDTSTTSGSMLNSMTSSDRIYLCANERYGGVSFNIGTANDQNHAMTALYSDANTTLSALSITDKTNSTGTLAIDGSVTFTPPGDWTPAKLSDLLPTLQNVPTLHGYWIGLKVAGTLKATTQIKAGGINESTLGLLNARGVVGRAALLATTEYVISIHEEVGGLEFLAVADASTTVRIDWFMR